MPRRQEETAESSETEVATGRSSSAVAHGLLRAFIALLVLALGVALVCPRTSTIGRPARDAAIARSAEAGPPPHILALDVEQSRPENPGHSELLGVSSSEGKGGDPIRVAARLDTPAYCYLIALDPDGCSRLVDPSDPRALPAPRREIRYPAGEPSVVTLPDAAALQGWLLVASAAPLPPYADWRPASQLRWRSVVARGVWRFDGCEVRQFQAWPGPSLTLRTLADSPRPFAQICGVLRDLPELDAVSVIVYPVRPRTP